MPRQAPPVKLVASLLAADETVRALAVRRLAERFGPLDLLSRPLAFGQTEFYEREMGPGLTRRLAAFTDLVETSRLASIKRVCMSLERDLSEDGKRRVNIDPGLLGADCLVLATSKYRGQRVTLEQGIYADLTLFFHQGRYRSLIWTYPDYAGDELCDILMDVRRRYLWQLRTRRGGRDRP